MRAFHLILLACLITVATGAALVQAALAAPIPGIVAARRPTPSPPVSMSDQRAAHSWVAIGDQDAHVGRWSDALRAYNEALCLVPNDATIVYQRATAYLASGQLRQAVSDFRYCERLHPQDARAIVGLGNAWLAMRDYTSALNEFHKGLAATPHNPLMLCGCGDAYRGLGNNQAALADYSAALLNNKHCAQAYNARGKLRLELGQARDGLRDLQSAAAIAPTPVYLRNLRAAQSESLQASR